MIKRRFRKSRLLRLFAVALLFVSMASCEDDYCYQSVTSTKISNGMNRSSTVTICHNGETMEINASALQSHLNHGDTEGSCAVLSVDELEFEDGLKQEINCSYELPFIYTRPNGESWLFTQN